MPELDPFDARLEAAVHRFADRAQTSVDAAATAERAMRSRHRGRFRWLRVAVPVPVSILVVLALLMGAVTYPWRAVPLLAPGFDRLAQRDRDAGRAGVAVLLQVDEDLFFWNLELVEDAVLNDAQVGLVRHHQVYVGRCIPGPSRHAAVCRCQNVVRLLTERRE